MRIRLKKRAGYTLVEIMCAVSIIGLLATISVPSMFKSRDLTNLSLIRSNLRQIDNIKQQWAIETAAAPDDIANPADLQPYFKGQLMPKPAMGEVYLINAVTEPATAILPSALGSLPAGTVLSAE